MFHVRDYHLALDKLQTAALTLTERDFDVLQSFNPADEVRGRAAQRAAQLGPFQTKELTERDLHQKATDPPPRATATALDSRLARVLGKAISQSVVVPIGERLGVLTRRIEELETLTKQQAATLVDLRDENAALGQLVVNTQRPKPSLDSPRSIKH